MPRIRAFADQQRDREPLMRLADRATVELLLLMDLVTTQGAGVDELAAAMPEDAASAYLEFRAFFGPRIKQSILVAVGQAFQMSTVDADGLVTVAGDLPRRQLDGRVSLVGRLAWIASELPLLKRHGELYEEEQRETDALVDEILRLDTDNAADMQRARAIWPRAEELYKWAQQGARISRGDPDALEYARSVLDAWEADLAREEVQARRRIAFATGAAEPDASQVQEAIEAASERVDEVTSQLRAARRRVEELTGLSNEASERLTELLALR